MPAPRAIRHRAPAVMIDIPQQIPRHFKEISRAKAYNRASETGDLALGNSIDFSGHWTTQRLDMVQVNPVLEPPKLVLPSFSAPIIRWGVRQFNRTYMAPRPRFQERFPLVGHLLKQVQDRRRMQGVQGRQAAGAFNYLYPEASTAQRAVVLLGPPR